jgi:hypothetical protein
MPEGDFPEGFIAHYTRPVHPFGGFKHGLC